MGEASTIVPAAIMGGSTIAGSALSRGGGKGGQKQKIPYEDLVRNLIGQATPGTYGLLDLIESVLATGSAGLAEIPFMQRFTELSKAETARTTKETEAQMSRAGITGAPRERILAEILEQGALGNVQAQTAFAQWLMQMAPQFLSGIWGLTQAPGARLTQPVEGMDLTGVGALMESLLSKWKPQAGTTTSTMTTPTTTPTAPGFFYLPQGAGYGGYSGYHVP